jgi:hypothetical protein
MNPPLKTCIIASPSPEIGRGGSCGPVTLSYSYLNPHYDKPASPGTHKRRDRGEEKGLAYGAELRFLPRLILGLEKESMHRRCTGKKKRLANFS